MTAPVPPLAYLPEILTLVAALGVFLLDTLGVRRRAAFGAWTTVFLAAAFVSVLADLGVPGLGGLATLPSSYLTAGAVGPIVFTALGLVFQAIFLSAGILVAFASLSDPDDEVGIPMFYGLLGLATLGTLLVALSADLVFLLLSVEVTGISTYVLVGYTRRDPRALEASMKFYIIGALSTATSFFGASLLYGAYHTTSLATISQGLPPDASLALVGFGILAVGLGFKVTAVPFHMWAVDVYDGAPSTVSAFLSAGSKKMGIFAYFVVFVAVTRLFAGPQGWPLYIALGGLAVATMTVGNILALQQKTLKRMLAYSSISQAGYMLLGIAVDTPSTLSGATLLVAAHVLMKGGAFLVVAALAQIGLGARIDDLRGLGYSHPILAGSFSVLLLSLAGIPGTFGFMGKFYIFAGAIEAGGLFILLAVVGLLNSALSVFYYARILKIVYMSDEAPAPSQESGAALHRSLTHSSQGVASPPPRGIPGLGRIAAEIRAAGAARWIAIVAAAVLTVALGIYPTPLVHAFNAAATQFWSLGY